MSVAFSTLAFANIGPWQIILIVFIVLLLFGAKRLPDLFRGLGQGVKEFKKATRDIEDDIRSAVDDEPRKTPKAGSPDTKPREDPAAEKEPSDKS
ncbi:MAG: twin-arginine translocase TatA/TatE family subunit [Opitutales bacterium]|nr:twin-arginine translocase TatA/TatE family subunit [Opitutales bacterium]